MKDHVHMCISVPPKYAVSNVVGYIKGKSAIAVARSFKGKQRNFNGEHLWARGYFVSTVGLDEEMVRELSMPLVGHTCAEHLKRRWISSLSFTSMKNTSGTNN
jgi:hypothetical protein